MASSLRTSHAYCHPKPRHGHQPTWPRVPLVGRMTVRQGVPGTPMGPGDPTGIRQGMLQPSQHGEKSIPRALQCCQRLTGANAWPFCTLPLPTSPSAAPALLARLGTALRGSGYPRGTRTRDRERRETLETPTPQQPRLRPASSSPLTSSKQQESQSRALPWVSGWTRAGRSTAMLRDVSTCPRLSQRGHLRPRLPEAALSFAGRYPSSERLLQVAGHGQRQPVVVGRCHQLDAQRQALTAQPQRALSDGQPQDVEDGWKKGGGITDPSPPPPPPKTCCWLPSLGWKVGRELKAQPAAQASSQLALSTFRDGESQL